MKQQIISKIAFITSITALAAVTSASAALTITDSGATAPASFEEHSAGNTWTRIAGTAGRGQTFTAPLNGADNAEVWGLTAITIETLDFEIEPVVAPTMQLQIYEWDGGLTAANNNGTSLYNETATFAVGGTFTGGDHVTFNLGETVNLTEGANYAFYMAFTDGTATFRPRVGSSTNASHPGALVNGAPGTLKTNQDLEFYLTGAIVPEPSSTALLGLGGLALILRRRK